jgi:hypothetical protein
MARTTVSRLVLTKLAMSTCMDMGSIRAVLSPVMWFFAWRRI